MRPINLIPPEDQRGASAPTRTGPIVYIVVGALVAALAGVTALALTNGQISDRKAEIVKLKREDAVVGARAQRLSSYTAFRTLDEQRIATVGSLADSRFDWERVMRELSLILPSDVWLTNLTATASPQVSIGSGGGEGSSSGGNLRGAIAGPALEINGCADGQEGVAGFVTTLKDIDGVTRVGVQSSALPEIGKGAGVASGGGSGSSDCRTRRFVAQFQIVVAFDAAPITQTSTGEEVAAAPAAESTEEGSTTTPAEG